MPYTFNAPEWNQSYAGEPQQWGNDEYNMSSDQRVTPESDPFQWLLQQPGVNMRQLLRSIGVSDWNIEKLMNPAKYGTDEKWNSDYYPWRKRIGQKAFEYYKRMPVKESKNKVRITESQIRGIVRESIKTYLNEMAAPNFSNAMHYIWKALKGLCGEEELKESMVDWFYDYHDDSFKYNQKGFYFFARAVANYDLICVKQNGRVDVKGSNHPDIARRIAPFLTPEDGVRIYNSFGW